MNGKNERESKFGRKTGRGLNFLIFGANLVLLGRVDMWNVQMMMNGVPEEGFRGLGIPQKRFHRRK